MFNVRETTLLTTSQLHGQLYFHLYTISNFKAPWHCCPYVYVCLNNKYQLFKDNDTPKSDMGLIIMCKVNATWQRYSLASYVCVWSKSDNLTCNWSAIPLYIHLYSVFLDFLNAMRRATISSVPHLGHLDTVVHLCICTVWNNGCKFLLIIHHNLQLVSYMVSITSICTVNTIIFTISNVKAL